MWVTASNCQSLSSGVLIQAYDEMSLFESDDIEREVEVLGVQSAVDRELEGRGWRFDELANEWVYDL